MICCIYLHAVIRVFFSVIPANAGVILITCLSLSLHVCYPRECGGDPVVFSDYVDADKVIPANAGVILILVNIKNNVSRYPRECGGDPIKQKEKEKLIKLSPRMRG